MGLFSFNKTPQNSLPWITINSTEQLAEVFNNLGDTPILLFKHSIRCSISSMVLSGFERNWTGNVNCELYFIDLITNRDVSNKIAELTGIHHQSPQAIVLKNKNVIYDATHTSIDAGRIEKIISKE